MNVLVLFGDFIIDGHAFAYAHEQVVDSIGEYADALHREYAVAKPQKRSRSAPPIKYKPLKHSPQRMVNASTMPG